MKIPKLSLNNEPATLMVLGIVGVIVLYYVGKSILNGGKQAATTAAQDLGAVWSGNNSLTQGTPYQGTGVLGTLGAAVNSGLGGAPESIGNTVGGWAADLFGPSPTPATTMDSSGGVVPGGLYGN